MGIMEKAKENCCIKKCPEQDKNLQLNWDVWVGYYVFCKKVRKVIYIEE